jgi:hypothetical protein
VDKVPDKIQMIYHPNTLSQLCYLKATLDWSKQGVDAFLVSVLMGAMHGQSSGFLSVSMPNTFSMGWNYIKKYIKEKNLECPDRNVFEVLEKRVRRYLKKGYLAGTGTIIEGDVRDLDSKVEHNSVQLLFTSPPYLKVIKYGLYNWIRLWFLTESGSHEEVDAKLDDTHALNEYLEFMKDTLTATLPLLDRERGLSCWAIGDVKGLNLAWAVWHHAGSQIEIKADDGTVLRYKLISIVEDKIPDNQKVSKIWKTLEHHLEYVNQSEEIVESIGKWVDQKEAKAALKEAEEKEGLVLRIRTVKTNDKSGKATPTDRILIIAPDSSNPKALMKTKDLDWKPFHTSKITTLDDFNEGTSNVGQLHRLTVQTRFGREGMPSHWEDLKEIGPCTKKVFEYAQNEMIDTVSRLKIPNCLGLPRINPNSGEWHDSLQLPSNWNPIITNREVLLRFLLAKAIVDQGSDTPGVQLWFQQTVTKCYEKGIYFLHFPNLFVERYPEVLDIAHNAAIEVTANRGEVWANMQPGRKIGHYTPFNVDGMRGGKYTHWFTSSRLFPAVMMALASPGGLTEIIFHLGPENERPLDFARNRLRKDKKYGLGFGIGDKAADLFVKWAIGCLDLTPKEERDWRPTEAVIPMDQRIGRVMMRCGFMEEFFDTKALVESGLKRKPPMFVFNDRVSGNDELQRSSNGLLDTELFLWVREFRRKGRVSNDVALNWCKTAWAHFYEGRTPPMDPQTVVQLLCKSITSEKKIMFSAAHLDDFFFDLAEDYCHDKNPICSKCPINDVCLANTVNGMDVLKKYIT